MSSCNSITHAAVAPSNLGAAITKRSAEADLQNTIELRATASEIAAPKPDLDTTAKNKYDFDAFFKRKIASSNLRKSRDESRPQPWCSQSNTIYDAQLQKTIILRTQPWCHATFMQLLQCVLHITWLTHISLCTWQHSMETFMQPLYCDLQPESQQTHRTTHTWATTRCSTQRRNQFDVETIAHATAAHTRYLSSPAAANLQGKTQGFVLRLSRQRKPHATFMQPLQCVLQHHVANPHLCMHRPHEVPFIAGCSQFTGKNTRFRAPAFPPTQAPCNIHAATMM